MYILDKYGFGTPAMERRVLRSDINMEIDELLEDVRYIEKRTGKTLDKERSAMCLAYDRCKYMTRNQCVSYFADMRAAMMERHGIDAKEFQEFHMRRGGLMLR